jgi:putative ABC transport system permease protein
MTSHTSTPPYQSPSGRPAAGAATPASNRMRPLHEVKGLTGFALRRQWHHPGVTLLALLRVIFAVGLVTYAAFFSDAVQRVILNRLLTAQSQATGRPPFSSLVYTFPSSDRPISLQAAEELMDHVAGTLSAEVALPTKHVGLRVGSGAVRLHPGEDSNLYNDTQSSLGVVNLVYIADVGEHIDIPAGDPMIDDGSGEAIDVWMPALLAEEMGVQVGDVFNAGVGQVDDVFALRVRGFWQASDPEEAFWFDNPETSLKESILVRRSDYINRIEPFIPSKTRQIFWHVILDESKVDPGDARNYIQGFDRGEVIISKYVPDVRVSASPLGSLDKFVARETVLTTLLLSFTLPAFGFLLYFLVLTSAIIARWQRRDTASLVSRGMSIRGILGLTTIDELLLFVVGLPLGIAFGMLLARLMGHTASFLSFIDRPAIPVGLLGINWLLVFVALAVSLIARLLPTAQAARQSAVTFDQERARPLRAPFWYRYYLDFLLLLVTIYVYVQFRNQGTLALLVQDRPQDLYQDPLLILVPALFILTAAMLTVRIIRLLLRAIDRTAGMIPWTTPYIVLRRLSRQSSEYINPLLLIIVALGVGIYTLSMAASLDQWLVDRMYYRVGADATVQPLPPVIPGSEGTGAPVDGAWIPLPDEFANLRGVEAASRLGDYSARITFPGGNDAIGRFLAIDRVRYPSVAWFRSDFAEESLGALMNRLAQVPDGILISEELAERNHLQVGDLVRITVSASRGFVLTSQFTIAGTFKFFPTVYEEEKVAVIGNIDYLSSIVGSPLPHDVLLSVDQDVEEKDLLKAVWSLGIGTGQHMDARALIEDEQAGMERVGVFGTLSVGFLAAVIMAALGLMLYTYASLRDRLFRFAVLRAMGLKRRKIIGQVILEYGLLTALGATVGALIGIAASELFVPFFKVTGEQGVPLPPLVPTLAQQEVRQLVIAFAAAMVLLQIPVIARSLSWRHFQILRGGE